MKRRSEKHLSRAMLAAFAAIAGAGLFLLYTELPSIRRYVRIERM
jgi:hypothetical protein